MKKLHYGALAAAAALVMSACGSGGTEGGAGESDTGTIRVLVPNFSANAEDQAVFEQIVDVFHEQYPDIEVESDFVPYDSLNQKISTAMAANDNYDVISAGIGWVQPLADLGVFEDLSELGVDRDAVAEDVDPAFVDPLLYEDTLYALPVVANPRLVAYSRSAFESAGLDPDQPPQSLEELREYAQQLTERDDAGNITQTGFDFWAPPSNYRQQFIAFMGALGGQPFTDGEPTLNSDAGVEALELIHQMVTVDQSSTYGYQNSAQTALVTTGEAAMGFTSPYVDCSEDGIGEKCDDLEYFTLTDEQPAMYVGGRVVGVGAGTDYPEAALAFAQAFQDLDVQEGISRIDVGVPVSLSAGDSDFWQNNPAGQYAWENLEHAVFEYGGASFLDFRAEFGSALDAVILGEADARETLDQLAEVASD